MPRREILIANRHPRLRLDRRAVARVIHTLDASFFPASAQANPVSGDSKIKSPLRRISEGGNRKSKMRPPPGELSLVFLTDAALAELHANFLADPAPTDVITFEGDPGQVTAGEICVSPDAAFRHIFPPAALRSSSKGSPKKIRSARTSPRTVSGTSRSGAPAFSTELTLYLVHGWLHLAGYDDLQPAKKRIMRRAETRAMKLLQIAGSLPRFSLRR